MLRMAQQPGPIGAATGFAPGDLSTPAGADDAQASVTPRPAAPAQAQPGSPPEAQPGATAQNKKKRSGKWERELSDMHQIQEEHQKSLRQMSSDLQSLRKAMSKVGMNHQAALHPDRQAGRTPPVVCSRIT